MRAARAAWLFLDVQNHQKRSVDFTEHSSKMARSFGFSDFNTQKIERDKGPVSMPVDFSRNPVDFLLGRNPHW